MRLSLFFFLLIAIHAQGQKKAFTRSDSLRGSITAERAWWDVLRYDIVIKPDYRAKSTEGENTILYKVLSAPQNGWMQVDLQPPLQVNQVLLDGKQKADFRNEGNAWFIKLPRQKPGSEHLLKISFGGKVHEAIRPPWDGGWTFTKDSLGRPWMTVTCQGIGASVWYPCKDHQSDEPDRGASLTMIVPDTLMAVANGRLISQKNNNEGTASYTWAVVNPINNYNIIPYIGKYVNYKEVYAGEKGALDLDYWVLDYNLEKAKTYLSKELHQTLKAFEHWFGPYPFYEDGFKLVDVSYPGMEHQSAVSYGNNYKPGYGGRDGSGTGWGMKWDFIVVHETGHEWFGNNITTNDLADMWVHEGFTNYSETLFVDYMYGTDAGNEYNYGIRRGIMNAAPIIPQYNVNAKGPGDMYPKGGNLLHTIRHSMNNDSLFRQILRGLNKDFYHSRVNTSDVENYISKHAGFNFSKVFDQYLRNTKIPVFEFYFNDDRSKVFYRWSGTVKGFDLPLHLKKGSTEITIHPNDQWSSSSLNKTQQDLFDAEAIRRMYYVNVLQSNPGN
jgi:aminopeptidase N